MADLSSIKVLIVEDDLNIRKIIKTVIVSLGVKEISEATNGKEAYDLLKVPRGLTPGGGRKKYDLVVCDWMMPIMNGIELLEKIRKDPFLKTTKFLMVTAENDRENITRALQDGVSDYVVKPFTARTLESAFVRIAEKLARP